MSGGGLGLVIQASLDDPATPSFENIVLIGGTNDMKEQNFTNNQLFADNIDRFQEKLKVAVREVPDKNFLLVKQMREQDRPKDQAWLLVNYSQTHLKIK